MKLKGNKEKNYAYNINSSSNNLANKKISFKGLNKNFYGDLISSDINLKRNKYILSEIKNKSIKECVYCNKEIPKTWKTILDYRDEVYKAIDQDPDFAHYIGTSNKEERTNDFFETKLKSVQNLTEKKKPIKKGDIPDILKEFKESEFDEKSKKDLSKTKNIILDIADSNIGEKSEKNLIVKKESYENKTTRRDSFFKAKTSHHFFLGDKNNDLVLNDKLISSKLDEYRTKYDMNKFMNDLRVRRNKEGKDKELLNYVPQFIDEKKNNYREFLKDKTQNNKENVLKSSIYSNLLPNIKSSKNIITKTKSLPKIPEKKFVPGKTTNLFLNQHLEFDTPIEITNPKVKRDLELINYYGPMYTNCHVCNRRNLEFYQNSEPKQTLILLSYLKKIKLGEEEDNTQKNKESN